MTQEDALSLLKLGHNIFLTGAAGSGKTYVLNKYITYLKAHGVPVAVTASTGIAATHLGGTTIHSWSGIGIADALSDSEFDRLAKRKKLGERFRGTKVLIIDEISMLHAHQLDLVDWVARRLLDFTKPFGGLQLVLCGDFFQLPPVSRGERAQYAFESRAWREGQFLVCYLDERYRHGNDPLAFVLKDIRSGNVGEHTKMPLRARYKKPPEIPISPTRLFTHNRDVDALNDAHLATLSGIPSTFSMTSSGPAYVVDTLMQGCLAPKTLHLKVGAVVMFVKNNPDVGYVNGTLGIVEGFDPTEGWPLVRTANGDLLYVDPLEWRLESEGEVLGKVNQVPLRLAWAITVHKSQGMTLDAVEVDLSKSFEEGMGYVALSRVRTLGGLTLMGLNDMALRVNQKVRIVDVALRHASNEASAMLARYTRETLAPLQQEVLTKRFGGSTNHPSRAPSFISKERRRSRKKKASTYEETKALMLQKKSIAEAARVRNLTPQTIIGHLEILKQRGSLPPIVHLKPPAKDFARLRRALLHNNGALTPAAKALNGAYSFEYLRLARLFL